MAAVFFTLGLGLVLLRSAPHAQHPDRAVSAALFGFIALALVLDWLN